MSEKSSGVYWKNKSQVLREVQTIKARFNTRLNKASQNDQISSVTQDPQVNALLKEAEEVLHTSKRIS